MTPDPDGLVESEADPAGIRCETVWCTAFHDWAASCGDPRGDYAGLVHANRAVRAEARDKGESYAHGRVCPDARYDSARP